MRQRRLKPTNPITIVFLLLLIVGVLYFNQVVVPTVPAFVEPSRTPTRSPESFLNEAGQAFQAGKLKAAIDAYKQAILVDPANASTYVALARVQVFDGQYADALDSAEKSLVLSPDYSLAHAVRGWALSFLGKSLEAAGAVNKAISLDPNNGLAYAYYTEILVNSGSYENIQKAIDISRKAESLAPQTLETFRARALVLYTSSPDNYDAAIEQYKAAISLNGKLWDLHFSLGYVYALRGDYDLSVEEMNTAFSLNPTNPEIPTELSRTYAKAGQFGTAVQYAEQAVNIDMTSPRLHGNLGVMLYRSKKEFNDRAIAELGLAVRGGKTADGVEVKGLPLEPGKVADEYFSIYGWALARADRCNEAVPIFQAIIQNIAPDQIAYDNATQGIAFCQETVRTPAPEVTATP